MTVAFGPGLRSGRPLIGVFLRAGLPGHLCNRISYVVAQAAGKGNDEGASG